MVNFSRLKEKVKLNLKYIATFYYEETTKIIAWWLWNIPFQFFQILFSLLLFKYYALALKGSSFLFEGDYMAYIISGLMLNTYMDASMDVYYSSMVALYHGRIIGFGGISLSRKDYLQMAGISPYIFIFARASWRYLMETIMFILYFIIGAYCFGIKALINFNLNIVIIILLSILACSGIGLISASMYWLAGAYRGVEPIVWFIRILVPLACGVYVPREILPRELKLIGDILPQTYAVNAMRKILLKQSSLNEILDHLMALILQIIMLIPVGILLLKYSLALERKRATAY